MPIERWEPFREGTSLREAMDRLFQDSFIWPRRPGGAEAQGWFPLDLVDRADHLEVRAEIPGLKPEEITVDVRGDVVTIRGEHKAETERKEDNWLIRERQSGSFSRSMRLPSLVDSDKSQARYQDGVLTLTLPKKEESKSRQVKVNA